MADKPNPFLLESNWRKDGGKRKRDSEDDVEIVLVEEKGSKVDCTVTDDDDIQADIDYAIALSLQESEETNNSLDDPRSIVDERLEYEDPHPNIHDLFIRFDAMFFGRRLINAGVAVMWGPRMTLCAGLCCYEGRGGLCSIKLSEPLLKLRTRKDLVETLLHEMIHALLFVTFNNKDRESHGPEFISHMKRINELAGTNITVYHSFHDEVNVYRQHWWKCDGACQYRKPYYGIIRRAVNRAPSKNDYWWAEHQATCGGTFIKIKEPDNYSSKKKTSKKDERKQEKMKDIRTMLETSSKTDTHTTETHSGTGMDTKTSRSKDDSLKERREKMLKAAEKRLSKNKSKDIRTFTTTPSNQTVTPSNQTADSTPSNQEVASVLSSRVDKRVCPVCGRDDIPEPILQPHITLCIDEMSNND